MKQIPRRDLAIGVFVVFLVYMTFRIILQVRRARGLARPRSSMNLSGNEGKPSDQLTEWLQNLPDETEDDSHVPGVGSSFKK